MWYNMSMKKILKRNLCFYKGDRCLTCNKPITNRNKSGYCRSCRGSFHTQETKDKMSKSKMGDKNPMWKGDKVQYGALHDWMRSRIPKPKKCELCHKRPAYDLANKGIYDRNKKNWWYICRSCHMKTDGRINNLKQYSKK